MEDRKQQEVDYYDREAQNISHSRKEAGSLMKFNPLFLESYRFLKKSLQGKNEFTTALDYGCGTGVHLPWLAKECKKVIGIDLSKKSLEKAEEVVVKEGLSNRVELVVGDCENMDFPDKNFDLVLDGGTLSSLDLEKAFYQIHRVLRPGGLLIGIETLGHNPITNAKRKLNEIFGKRTSWAQSHIFKMSDLQRAKKYFNIVEVKFFHPISFIAFPLVNIPGGKMILKMFEGVDHVLLAVLPFLKRYSFKIVFVMQKVDDKKVI